MSFLPLFIFTKQFIKESIMNGDYCRVIGGTHKGKSGRLNDLHVSKTGHQTITVQQSSGIRFKTLLKNVQKIEPEEE
ncbi:KOW motif-containing protein [Sphingobacterium mizutaii]|uniref:KOW motif-containing protein n=1 Tax=Sphingobacterium mizutaii TaxID=1010 RepID=UPI002899E811|nr:KOW motif-containing protein [Sphingobacterium mizutaii]